MTIPHDYHMHTRFSCDSEAEMADMCRSAIEKGIPEIGFTEHYDLHPDDSCRDYFKPDLWWQELERCRERFAAEGLTVRAGIELGEPHLFADECQSLVARYPFDYCLGSLHRVGQWSIFDREYFNAPMDEGYRNFFEELGRMTSAGGFDILSHFDVVLRYGVQFYGGYDPSRYEDVIRPVLQNCIERGIALDINTAVVRRRAAQLTPGAEVLAWYREMGGERITLGSDSHKPENVGADLDKAIAAAHEAGLTHLTQFERRQPRMIPLNRTLTI